MFFSIDCLQFSIILLVYDLSLLVISNSYTHEPYKLVVLPPHSNQAPRLKEQN